MMYLKFIVPAILIVVFAKVITACTNSSSDKKQFEDVLNDPRVNSKEVGELDGIKYFQVVKNGKTGFRDMNGKIVIDPIFDNAEMFSEGMSAVSVNNKWGYINMIGKYVIEPKFDFAGSFHEGLADIRDNNSVNFIDKEGKIKFKTPFYWVDEFSEGLCMVKTKDEKYGFIDTTGKVIINLQYQNAMKFENGIAKVQQNKLWGSIDKSGKNVEPITHKYNSW